MLCFNFWDFLGNLIWSVIGQKSESQSGGNNKTKLAKFSKKTNIFYQNDRSSNNLACFAFLLPPVLRFIRLPFYRQFVCFFPSSALAIIDKMFEKNRFHVNMFHHFTGNFQYLFLFLVIFCKCWQNSASSSSFGYKRNAKKKIKLL